MRSKVGRVVHKVRHRSQVERVVRSCTPRCRLLDVLGLVVPSSGRAVVNAAARVKLAGTGVVVAGEGALPRLCLLTCRSRLLGPSSCIRAGGIVADTVASTIREARFPGRFGIARAGRLAPRHTFPAAARTSIRRARLRPGPHGASVCYHPFCAGTAAAQSAARLVARVAVDPKRRCGRQRGSLGGRAMKHEHHCQHLHDAGAKHTCTRAATAAVHHVRGALHLETA